jgi:ketosteroid isomerase-like protein
MDTPVWHILIRGKDMNQSNSTVVQNVYAAFNRGDIQSVLGNVESNAEWVNYGPNSVPYFGIFTGRITDFFQAIGQSTIGGNVAVDRYIDAGDSVVTEGRWTATVKDTRGRIDARIAHIFTLRDGKISSWRGYSDTAAVAAAHSGKGASA